jgi:hypothetical protein
VTITASARSRGRVFVGALVAASQGLSFGQKGSRVQPSRSLGAAPMTAIDGQQPLSGLFTGGVLLMLALIGVIADIAAPF